MQLVYIRSAKMEAMITILWLSLSSVSFPGISRQLPIIRIPHVIFFIGKHFGTGVILSTAFCHLLEDAFRSLNKPIVKERYHKIGKWTGLIILSSLLAIFLVDYISTTYVDYLQDDLSTPIDTPKLSRSTSKCSHRTRSLADNPSMPNDLSLIPDLGSRHCVKCCLTVEEREQILYYNGEIVDVQRPKVGNKRQIVGILVLQLGIMIHSLVIGLTLSIAQGSEFASLLVAICFHQVFEGLSLGIRIDALPPSSSSSPSTPKSSSHVSLPSLESTSLIPSQCLTPSYASTRQEPARYSHTLTSRFSRIHWIKIVLSLLFAVTTPFGMIVGLYAFSHGGHAEEPDQQALVLLTQGVMSAISAGMLIYATTVGMIAGDFMFGDVSGGHSHHPSGHGKVGDLESHSRPHEQPETSTSPLRRSDREPRRDRGSSDDDRGRSSSVGQKVLAVVSLFAGVAVMNVTSLFE